MGHVSDMRYLDWPRSEWRKTKNPIYPWTAILSCFKNGDVPPRWAMEYFADSAERLFSLADRSDVGDFGRQLPWVLGFDSGTSRNHQLKAVAAMVANEQLAMRFAFYILKGREPTRARGDVKADFPKCNEDKLPNIIKAVFELKRAPTTNRDWKVIIINWLLNCPAYADRYPELPAVPTLIKIMVDIREKRPLRS